MATNWNEIKNKIVLEGEGSYKKAMAEINRALREAKSEMKATSAEFDANGSSVDALRANIAALENVEQGQILALSTMREQLEKVEGEYGKNSREATELRTRINNMRAEMAKSANEIKQFRARLDEAENTMADSIGDAQKAGDAIGELGEQAQKAQGDADGLLGKLKELKGFDVGKLGVAGAVAGAAGKAVVEATEKGNEQTQARGQIAAYTGATGAQLDALEAAGRDLYEEGFGDSLKEASQSLATVHTYTKAAGDDLQRSTEIAYRLNDIFGMDIPESARAAQQMMTVFGGSAQQAYALIAAGAQDGADKNGNLLDTINEYAPYYEKAGKSAEEFIGTLTAGAQSGVYDVDKIGDAMKEFTIRITDGSEGTKEALKSLGLEAADVPAKFAVGGETASAAFDLVIDSLLKIKDPLAQSQAGIALFGTQWEDTGGAVLQIFDGISSGAADATGAVEALNSTRLEDLDVAVDRVARRVETRMGDLGQPLAKEAAGALNVLADNIDEQGGKIVAGVMTTVGEANKGVAQAAADVFEEASDAYDTWAQGFSSDVASGKWIDDLKEKNEETKETVEAVTQTVEEQRAALDAKLAEINQAIADADIAGNYAESAKLMQERDAIIADIAALASDVKAGYTALGTDSAEALESQAPKFKDAAIILSQDAIDGMDSKQPDMLDAGKELGGAGEVGFEAGTSGMEDAGSDAADGAVSGMRSGISSAYNAGYATGKAYERGYRAATDTHSPSRVMEEAAHDTTAGLLGEFKRDEARLYDAAAAMGDAVREGYTSQGALSGTGGGSGGFGVTAEELAGATVRALLEAGIGFHVDSQKLAELTARGVSRKIANDSQATIKGQGAATRGW